jgi:MYXO-CTERM domain-containing protein
MPFLSSRSFGLLAVCAGVAFASPSAKAGPPEFLSNAAFHPSDENMLVVRYEGGFGGLLLTRDGGKSFRVLPSRAFTQYGADNTRMALRVGSDGKVLVGLSDGLFVDDGKGCGMGLAQPDFDQQWVAAMAPHPSNPDITYFVTTGDTEGKHAGVWKRDKSGVLTALGKSEPVSAGVSGVIVQGLGAIARAASTEGVRIIETGTRQTYMQGQDIPTTAPILRYSDDLGATWTESPVPDPDKTQGQVRLLAAEAGEPMKLVVSLEVYLGSTDKPDQVLLSTDGAQSFTTYSKDLLSAGQALVLPDGQLLLADNGSPGGLWKAERIGKPLTKISEESTKCLALQPKTNKVFACRGYEVGMLDVAKGDFCGIFQMNETVGPVECTPDILKNAKVEGQLCDAWCGPAHYAFSPLCALLNPPMRTCGLAARAYDSMDPDPNKRWVEPPGERAATRCAGFERVVPAADAGVPDAGSSVSDAGVSSEAGASVEEAGTTQPEDAGANAPDAGTPSKPKSKDGCSVASGSAEGERGVWLLAGLLGVLAARRRRR